MGKKCLTKQQIFLIYIFSFGKFYCAIFFFPFCVLQIIGRGNDQVALSSKFETREDFGSYRCLQHHSLKHSVPKALSHDLVAMEMKCQLMFFLLNCQNASSYSVIGFTLIIDYISVLIYFIFASSCDP